MSLHEPTIADLQQALDIVIQREREAIRINERLEKKLAERNVLLEEANGIIVRQSKDLTMMCEENTRLETELATLRARGS